MVIRLPVPVYETARKRLAYAVRKGLRHDDVCIIFALEAILLFDHDSGDREGLAVKVEYGGCQHK